MIRGIWQLTRLSLMIDSRRMGLHAIRFGMAMILYFVVCYAQSRSLVFASGRSLFQSQLTVTVIFIALTAIFGFSQSIAEEKEDDTLGMIRLADISPLAIILGKTVASLLDALMLIAIQFPFTIIAITLGGVSWPQVSAAYVTLAVYLWLLAAIGILASVIQPTGALAARLTALVVLAYLVPPYIPTSVLPFSAIPYQITRFSLPVRLNEITESDFAGSPFHWAVAFGMVAGLACLIAAWFAFDRFALITSTETRPVNLSISRRFVRRAWTNPVIWRTYMFETGGIAWTIVRFGAQLTIIFLISLTDLSGAPYGFLFARSAILCGLFSLLDGTWSASRLFRDEIRNRTWSTLVQTPHSVPQLAMSKSCGWLLGLAPSIVTPILLIFATLLFHEHIDRSGQWEISLATITTSLAIFGYLHLLTLLSLYFGWKSIPLTLTTCFGAGWMYVYAVFVSQASFDSRCVIFGATCVVFVGMILAFQCLIVRRLSRLAEIA